MKKILLLVLLSLSVSVVSVRAQVKISLKFSPVLSINRLAATSDSLVFDDDNPILKLQLGAIMDMPITDTYSFSTGFIYMPKAFAVEISESTAARVEEYRLQYIQVPLTLKLYTNEIYPDVKIYFQLGGGLEFLLHHEPVEEGPEFIRDFHSMDFSAILGGGVEYKFGSSTVLYTGVTYNRALRNIIEETVPLDGTIEARNTIVSLDFGVKF